MTKKISQLSTADALSGLELFETVQNGVSKKTTASALATLAGNTTPQYVSVDTTGSTITLDMVNLAERMFLGSANITSNRIWALANSSNAVIIRSVIFYTNANKVHTFPSTFKMSDALWDSSAHTWTNIDAGTYEMTAVYNGTSWIMKILGPYS